MLQLTPAAVNKQNMAGSRQISTPGLGEPQGHLQGCSEGKEQCHLKPRAWLGSQCLDTLCTIPGMSLDWPPPTLKSQTKGQYFFQSSVVAQANTGWASLAGFSVGDFGVQWLGQGLNGSER